MEPFNDEHNRDLWSVIYMVLPLSHVISPNLASKGMMLCIIDTLHVSLYTIASQLYVSTDSNVLITFKPTAEEGSVGCASWKHEKAV